LRGAVSRYTVEMSAEKTLRSLYVDHTGRKLVRPDTVEFSVQVETIGEDREEVIKKHKPKADMTVEFKADSTTYKAIEALTTLEPIIGETRSGVKVVEKYHAITVARYRATMFITLAIVSDGILQLDGGRPAFDVVFSLQNCDGPNLELLKEVGGALAIKAKSLASAMALKLGPALTVETVRVGFLPTECGQTRSTSRGIRGAGDSAVEYAPTSLAKAVITPQEIVLEAMVRATYLLSD
jgi:hypothetical protein